MIISLDLAKCFGRLLNILLKFFSTMLTQEDVAFHCVSSTQMHVFIHSFHVNNAHSPL